MSGAGWVNEPTISEITYQEFEQAKKLFGETLKAFTQDVPTTPSPQPASGSGADGSRSFATSAKAKDGLKVLNYPASKNARFFQYKYGGNIVGLLALFEKTENCKGLFPGLPEIDKLIMHPSTIGGGATLLEHAVNISESVGGAGRICLISEPGAKGFYRSMGFEVSSGSPNSFSLDPRTKKEIWEQLGGSRWYLKKFAEVGHAAPR